MKPPSELKAIAEAAKRIHDSGWCHDSKFMDPEEINEFKQTFDPHTVKALIDRIEGLENRIGELAESREEIIDQRNAFHKRVHELEKVNAELRADADAMWECIGKDAEPFVLAERERDYDLKKNRLKSTRVLDVLNQEREHLRKKVRGE